ncbi:MAG: benzoylsuccinyl-CoA thiolase [Actinobacteria bacterium]|nr:MAG: benzoylsuccinyl-CoA thiolase [Actinomycetota bacterium]RIK08221.1 MAG: benzoylsuccinyl-CoA thiolase [Acidobacteriota bacterium]
MDEGRPALLGTRCSESGTYFFPPENAQSRVPGFAGSTLEEVRLSRTGTLWSYTNAAYQPPEPFVTTTEPFEPFCIAAVELAEEQMVVLGQVVAGIGVEDLEVGMEMELVLDTLYEDDDNAYVVWKWRPSGDHALTDQVRGDPR